MGNITLYNKLFLLFFLLIILRGIGYSQSLNSELLLKNQSFIEISGGGTQTTISNQGASFISEVDWQEKNSYYFIISAGIFFSKHFGISTGIGLCPYFTQLSLNSYANTLDTLDSENEIYERRIYGENITENQKIYFLEIPLLLNFQYPLSNTTGFFIQGGLSLSIPVKKTYSSTGTFTYSGYYPDYNVLLTDVPYEGFKSNIVNDIGGKLRINPLNAGIIASGGFYFSPSMNYQISLGFIYKRILNDISDYSTETSFQLSTNENQIRSLMERCEKVTASSMGLTVSLRYYVDSNKNSKYHFPRRNKYSNYFRSKKYKKRH